jgi:hypothetical protein
MDTVGILRWLRQGSAALIAIVMSNYVHPAWGARLDPPSNCVTEVGVVPTLKSIAVIDATINKEAVGSAFIQSKLSPSELPIQNDLSESILVRSERGNSWKLSGRQTEIECVCCIQIQEDYIRYNIYSISGSLARIQNEGAKLKSHAPPNCTLAETFSWHSCNVSAQLSAGSSYLLISSPNQTTSNESQKYRSDSGYYGVMNFEENSRAFEGQISLDEEKGRTFRLLLLGAICLVLSAIAALK